MPLSPRHNPAAMSSLHRKGRRVTQVAHWEEVKIGLDGSLSGPKPTLSAGALCRDPGRGHGAGPVHPGEVPLLTTALHGTT